MLFMLQNGRCVYARVSDFILFYFISAIGSMKTIDFKFNMSNIYVLQTLFSSNNRLSSKTFFLKT